MQSTKQEVMKLLAQLTDNCSLEDIQYHLYVKQKVTRGLLDAQKGRVYSQKEVEKQMTRWLKDDL
ncbi:MAG: hypothetical protein ACK4WF_02260 [Candidatus Brocadiales bacterium]